jgi:DNA-binding CsgD family transcriptional regulator
MTTTDALRRGRESFARHAWGDAHALLSAADGDTPLEGEDLERLAVAAYLLGRDDAADDAWTRAHHAHCSRGDVERAARCAFWIGVGLLDRGDIGRAGGWLARARRVLGPEHDSVEQGYLLIAAGLCCLQEGDHSAAADRFHQATAIGERFDDRDLVALGRNGEGRALIRQEASREGMALLDEVMVAVVVGDLSPIVMGDVYCSVISACHEIFDIGRAQEWTAALGRWCAGQPDLVPYRGQCMTRRAEIMQLRGAWPDAMDEARRACTWLSRPPGRPGVGAAFYQQAELHRLRGEPEPAEEAYRAASRLGRNPQPGLALLRLAQGQGEIAAGMIRAALQEAREIRTRPRLLAAAVEILIAASEVPGARTAAEELSEIAGRLRGPFLAATDAHATGAVLLAEGDAGAALGALREAWTVWSSLDAPYLAARTGVLIGLACRQLHDEGTAAAELDSARAVFQRLGAAPDLLTVAKIARELSPSSADGLTAREVQVLRLVATGRTNRAIAAELRISEKTVARHLSNIFTKLDLTSRAAATAYAFRHHLL